MKTVIGDFGFADDTGLVGEVEEAHAAEQILCQTMIDWKEKVHNGKTEGLRICSGKRKPYDVRNLGEQDRVRHVGGILHESGRTNADNNMRIKRGHWKINQVEKAWNYHGRTKTQVRSIPKSIRVKIMKASIMPTLSCFGRTRYWSPQLITEIQRIVNRAARSCLGVSRRDMQKYHIHDNTLCAMAQWEPFYNTMGRQSLLWLGHVARMPKERRPKQALFGWWEGHQTMPHAPFGQSQWLDALRREANIHGMDWFRMAQNRKLWLKTVNAAFPIHAKKPELESKLNKWLPGKRPIINTGTPEEKAKRIRTRATTEEKICPVCSTQFDKGNQLAFHYEEQHAVADPSIVTVRIFRCDKCKNSWRSSLGFKKHDCPKEKVPSRTQIIDTTNQFPGPPCNPYAYPGPVGDRHMSLNGTWHIYTDGSGGKNEDPESDVSAWGVAIFRQQPTDIQHEPVVKLYGPVSLDEWDTIWLGARTHSNNTAELSAIGEACDWLLREEQNDGEGNKAPATIYYDSTYAANMAQKLWEPQDNIEIARQVAQLVELVKRERGLHFVWVKGHSGNPGNEWADELADRGTQPAVSPHSERWSLAMASQQVILPRPKPKARTNTNTNCSKCGIEMGRANLRKHEADCRGSEISNRTCSKCQLLLGSVKARANHERRGTC
ncbi:unnamed protein product [Polarella glacialis]|uniref:ribonuclease H n=1 Tax=Polarella glacialis TaxID=89957 RepID=A0A813JKZ3_POLGL|nr:unnamed protein product [Polarella glacialis]